jgi:sodium/bile acid cotransporter 7
MSALAVLAYLWLASFAGPAGVVQTLYEGFRADFAQVPEVTVAELMAQPHRWVLVDVRTPEEQAVSRLPGAVLANQVEADAAAYRGKELLAYCTIGARSGEWAELWRSRGLQVSNLPGSVLAWTQAGGALVDPAGQPTKRVHVYSAAWNFAGEGYDPVW